MKTKKYFTPKAVSDYIKKHEQVNCDDICIYDVWYDSEGQNGCSCDKHKREREATK